MTQQPLPIAPSADALEIDAAHKVFRDALGTPREDLARAYLAAVVAKVKRRQEAGVL